MLQVTSTAKAFFPQDNEAWSNPTGIHDILSNLPLLRKLLVAVFRQYPPVHTAVVPAAAPTLDTIGGAEDGTWVGPSSCDQFTTALGSGQRVVSYSFYVPKW